MRRSLISKTNKAIIRMANQSKINPLNDLLLRNILYQNKLPKLYQNKMPLTHLESVAIVAVYHCKTIVIFSISEIWYR
ncbi:MAG: hypothetical protein PHR06_03020 [Candidatus Cloacimonetes bacterium]|nr:hypothetical protein [Candidatus Cloacimonadota bacterium]